MLVYILLIIVAIVLIVTISEVIYYIRIKPSQELPKKEESELFSKSVNNKSFEESYLYLSGDKDAPKFTEEEIYTNLLKQSAYMARRFDYSDFRAQLLF